MLHVHHGLAGGSVLCHSHSGIRLKEAPLPRLPREEKGKEVNSMLIIGASTQSNTYHFSKFTAKGRHMATTNVKRGKKVQFIMCLKSKELGVFLNH